MSTNNLDTLRAALFETLQAVKAGTLDLDKARAVNELGRTLIESAKVEVDYLKTTGEGGSSFISPEQAPALPPGITSVTRHRLRG